MNAFPDASPLDQILERLDAQPTMSEAEIQALLATAPQTQRELVQTSLRVCRQFSTPTAPTASSTTASAVPAQPVATVPFPVYWPEDQRGISLGPAAISQGFPIGRMGV